MHRGTAAREAGRGRFAARRLSARWALCPWATGYELAQAVGAQETRVGLGRPNVAGRWTVLCGDRDTERESAGIHAAVLVANGHY
ncbi:MULTISPECIES: hypothetical protein [Streptomyces]|uniref:Uncharacterized protein n=1 Tax=Streptomyces kaempferi TaxID=333725 RepID=A0ABW3XDQ3_9ACTN|nr:hypothetical protein [Streptomyces sp. NBC_01462]